MLLQNYYLNFFNSPCALNSSMCRNLAIHHWGGLFSAISFWHIFIKRGLNFEKKIIKIDASKSFGDVSFQYLQR